MSKRGDMKTKNITKNWLKKQGACVAGYHWFCNQSDKNEIKVIRALMKENRFDWANWVIVRRMKYKQYIRYAVYAAEQVIKIYEDKYPQDKRPRAAIRAAKMCIKNPTQKNKKAAYVAGAAAGAAAGVAYAAAESAADVAAGAAAGAAYAAAESAAYAAAESAADVVAESAAYAAAESAADVVAYAAESAAYAAAESATDVAAGVADAAAYAADVLKAKIINYGIKLLEEKQNDKP